MSEKNRRFENALLITLGVACTWGILHAWGPFGVEDTRWPDTAEPAEDGDAIDLDAGFRPPVELDQLQNQRIAIGEPLAAGPSGPEPEEIPLGSASLLALRWPDRAPITGELLTVVDPRAQTTTEHDVPASGRLLLGNHLIEDPPRIHVRVEGFEPLDVTPRTWERGIEYEALLRPTTGWIGRVVDAKGGGFPDVQVAGWWIEAARPRESPPVLGSAVAARLAGSVAAEDPPLKQPVARNEEPQGFEEPQDSQAIVDGDEPKEDPVDDTPGIEFLSAHAEVRATATTNDEGWYYLEPLAGYVLGQLTLFVDTELGSSDVLRVPLPAATPRLPLLKVHTPRPLSGLVVDTRGNPVADAKVIFEIGAGWSRTWPALTSDEEGRFEFVGPWCELAVAAEKTGYRLAQPSLWKPASADGMWSAMRDVAGHDAAGSALFAQAYGKWHAPLPRARGFAQIDQWQSDVRLVLEPLPLLAFAVVDAKGELELENARITATYGGLDRGQTVVFTDSHGRAAVPLSDREWQPMVVRIGAAGYDAQIRAISMDQGATALRIRLNRSDPALPSTGGQPPPNGLVLGPGGEPLAANLAIYVDRRPGRRPAWQGQSDARGQFRYDLHDPLPRAFLLFGATEGEELQFSGEVGPLGADLYQRDERVVLHLQPGPLCEAYTANLEAGRPYRIDWALAPFLGASPLTLGRVEIPESAAGRFRGTIPAHAGWQLEARLLGATIGSAPTMNLSAHDLATQPYTSTRFAWTRWDIVGEAARATVPFDGGALFFSAERRIDLSGTIDGMPWIDEPGTVYIGALGGSGAWFSPVSRSGWFQLSRLPQGPYRIVVYQRPEPGEGGSGLHERGDVRGEVRIDCEWSRHDLLVPWRE